MNPFGQTWKYQTFVIHTLNQKPKKQIDDNNDIMCDIYGRKKTVSIPSIDRLASSKIPKTYKFLFSNIKRAIWRGLLFLFL